MPNYLQRKTGHDYTAPSAYLITVVTEGRSRVLGTLVGASASEAAITLTMFGHECYRSGISTSAWRSVNFAGKRKMEENLHISEIFSNFAPDFGMCIFCTLQENNKLWQTK